MTDEVKAAKRNEHLEMLDRLADNKDFMCFIGQALDEFCAYTQGYGEVDTFRQGVRSAGGWIVNEIAKTGKGRTAIADAFHKHLTKTHKPTEE